MVRLNRTPFSHLQNLRLNRTHYTKFFNFSKRPIKSKFQQITQIPHSSPTQSKNYAKFAPFINIIHYVSDA